jgi:dTDP-4-dehydrorhamnose reductase
MRWVVTGAGGMLGSDAVDLLGRRGHDVTAASRAELEVTSIESARDAIRGHDVVLNRAAWTAVDDAEDREAYSVLSHESLVAAGVEPIGDWRERWLVAAGEVLGLS